MLREEIDNALKTAMKEQDKLRLSTLRLISAAVKDRDIANRGDGKPAADDAEVQGILARMVKQREESARLYDEGKREDLAQNERDEIEVIRSFLPKQLSEAQVNAAIDEALKVSEAEGLRDMGKVMAYLKERYTGRADFTKISAIIRDKLSQI